MSISNKVALNVLFDNLPRHIFAKQRNEVLVAVIEAPICPDQPGEGAEFPEALLANYLPDNAKPALHGVLVDGNLEAQPIGRHTMTKGLRQAAFPVGRDVGCVPQGLVELSRQASVSASLLTCREQLEFTTIASFTCNNR
jgi:hypothetical protein